MFNIFMFVVFCISLIISNKIWHSLVDTIVVLGLMSTLLLGLLYIVPIVQTNITRIPERVERVGDCYSVVLDGQKYDDVIVVIDERDESDQYSVTIHTEETLFKKKYETVTLMVPAEVEVLK